MDVRCTQYLHLYCLPFKLNLVIYCAGILILSHLLLYSLLIDVYPTHILKYSLNSQNKAHIKLNYCADFCCGYSMVLGQNVQRNYQMPKASCLLCTILNKQNMNVKKIQFVC